MKLTLQHNDESTTYVNAGVDRVGTIEHDENGENITSNVRVIYVVGDDDETYEIATGLTHVNMFEAANVIKTLFEMISDVRDNEIELSTIDRAYLLDNYCLSGDMSDAALRIINAIDEYENQ